jgi:hypothetical protein
MVGGDTGMIPARHPNATRYLGAPAGWKPEEQGTCGHLSICDHETLAGNAMQSIWEPTPDELARLNAGGFVVLTVIGSGHPPVSLQVWKPE